MQTEPAFPHGATTLASYSVPSGSTHGRPNRCELRRNSLHSAPSVDEFDLGNLVEKERCDMTWMG